ncbi:hypothetical protein EI983_14085 [Roseovarius faecimaris]|uniref:Uncharacterized protein n=1 Tax=Roseovarius faecimaris TaxID=2494550 RepID=A0A6I6J3G4_9RHOB|nr:hypothetical protein [Roseovarius faecimaris]QGX99328.1 hypothetical protein EI983_14085 [Roseovarius faecimaris]
MTDQLSNVIRSRLSTAARKMGTVDPSAYMSRAFDEAFDLPQGDARYGRNTLSPGAAPLEPSFSESEPYGLRFTMEPLGPHGSPAVKKQEASRQLRGLIAPCFGREALYWFDRVSEDHRGTATGAGLNFGAWMGAGFDRDGLYAAKAYYELQDGHLSRLTQPLKGYVEQAQAAMPQLRPLFSTITCRQTSGRQRITFRVTGPVRTDAFQPLLDGFGMERSTAQLTRLFGLALGGTFEAPDGSVLVGITAGEDGPEVKIELLIAAIPQIPDSFVELLRLGLSERPRHLRALDNWMGAFTPEGSDLPGDFSVMSIKLTRRTPAQVSLYLRPMGFEIAEPVN